MMNAPLYNKGNSFIHADSLNLFFKFFSVFIFGCVGSLYWTWAFLQLQQAGRGDWGVNSSLWCTGFSLRWLLTLRSTGCRQAAFRSCSSRALEHGLSCSRACGFFPDQGSNPRSCIGRKILIHCASREVPIQE